MNPWWNESKNNLRYSEYRVGTTIVYVGNRPNSRGTTKDFFDSIDGWINLSDRFIPLPKGVSTLWSPWNEAGDPSPETVFATIKTLNYWINNLKFKKIYIHCDAGTHRAPSIFGLYLLTYESEYQKIAESHVEYNKEYWSNPLEYANAKIARIGYLKDLLMEIKNSDNSGVGASLEMDILNKLPEQDLGGYFWKRNIKVRSKQLIQQLSLEFRSFVRYWTVGKAQWIYRSFHKGLNTKYGKELKRWKL